MDASNSTLKRSPALAAALSVLPGLGHLYAGAGYRGFWVLISALVAVGTVAWYGQALWAFAPLALWLWAAQDAASLAGAGRGRSPWLPVVAGLAAAIGIGWDVVQVDFSQASSQRFMAVARPMFNPDFIQARRETQEFWVELQMPCTADAPKAQRSANGFSMQVLPDCVRMGDSLIVTGSGFWPDWETEVWWRTPIGDSIALGENETRVLLLRTDENGSLTANLRVPSTANTSAGDTTMAEKHRVYFIQYRPLPGYELSVNGGYVVQGMYETLAVALMATTLSVLLAVPISFLAARNLMSGNPLTLAIYVVVRFILNVVRSIESLIVGIIFVVIVGLGPFAGVLALTFHSIAAIAKLYSEVIEGIDPGPIEAIRATGATWLQIVRYGVVPQIVPLFIAFTIFRWDINVRSSTIIGFVGGGGIGFFLIQWINLGDMRAVGAAFVSIAVVVSLLDLLSAKIRERVI